MMTHFILASQSPRRRQLLKLCGYAFDTMVSDVDETSISNPDAVQGSMQTARLKGAAILRQLPYLVEKRTIIIAADTIVTLDGQILGKPEDNADAKEMLSTLRGRTHEVHTGVAIFDTDSAQEILDSHSAHVKMRVYADHEIIAYIASGDPLDKAGAYAIQNPVFRPVEALDGCYLGVMGLSICHLLQIFDQLEISFRADLSSLKDAHQGFRCQLYDNIAQKHGK